jgi:hypothetical protein
MRVFLGVMPKCWGEEALLVLPGHSVGMKKSWIHCVGKVSLQEKTILLGEATVEPKER